MVKDGQVDAIIWLGPGEVWFPDEMAKGNKLIWMSADEDVLAKMAETCGVKRHVIPAAMFGGGVGESVVSGADSAELPVRSDLPEDLVSKPTKAVIEKKDDIAIASAGPHQAV